MGEMLKTIWIRGALSRIKEDVEFVETQLEELLVILDEKMKKAKCAHEWHADQDNDCNTCIKCGARQEIYTE